MIEMFLFVNPFGVVCLSKEKNILEWIDQCEQKVQFTIIPFLNLHTVQNYLEKNNLPTDDICFRNRLFQQMYSAVLDYEAILMQGKKKAREFLFAVQKAIGEEKREYSPEILYDILAQKKIDIAMFEEERNSLQVISSFRNNQKIAHEMAISQTPSLVLFNCSQGNDCGILLENYIDDCGILTHLCQAQDDDLVYCESATKSSSLKLLD